MVKHIWSVLCSKAIVDRESNNLSLIDVIERLGGPAIPAGGLGVFSVHLEVVTLWSRSDLAQPDRGRSRMRLLAPDNAVLGDPVITDLDLTGFSRLRTMFHIDALPVRGPGLYCFVIEVERDNAWSEATRIFLEVTLEGAIQAAAAPAALAPGPAQAPVPREPAER